jgi:hypothetical protein
MNTIKIVKSELKYFHEIVIDNIILIQSYINVVFILLGFKLKKVLAKFQLSSKNNSKFKLNATIQLWLC